VQTLTEVEINISEEQEFNHLNIKHIVKGLKFMRLFTYCINYILGLKQ